MAVFVQICCKALLANVHKSCCSFCLFTSVKLKEVVVAKLKKSRSETASSEIYIEAEQMSAGATIVAFSFRSVGENYCKNWTNLLAVK